jgi:N utilization substance protein B
MTFLYAIRGATRRATRLVVVQMLYQMEQQPEISAREIIETFTQLLKDEQQRQAAEQPSKPSQKPLRTKVVDMALLEKLLFGIAQNKSELDKQIAPFLRNNWSIARLPIILAVILRTATFEMQLKETPYQAIINEYIEIAKEFFPDSEAFFINGLLDNVSKHININD